MSRAIIYINVLYKASDSGVFDVALMKSYDNC